MLGATIVVIRTRALTALVVLISGVLLHNLQFLVQLCQLVHD